ncbi:hypothetical protein L1987_66755 [Smallanthus sonchifolius]|uniref:Uncharacterized protein n=1 Tax=Smallanthus sonchifolius TaxID=185202 RepID=A0ACB9BYC4_9ASTR|nr:hypothetical protein L1987_66755 [Smallanthus sonchifolius]
MTKHDASFVRLFIGNGIFEYSTITHKKVWVMVGGGQRSFSLHKYRPNLTIRIHLPTTYISTSNFLATYSVR